MREAGSRFAFAVTDEATGKVLGCTSYHDIVPALQRVEIGWTWYAQSVQRTHEHHLQAACCWATHLRHLRLLWSAGARTTSTSSRKPPSNAWAPKMDGVIRHHALRRDGTVRDTVMYSMRAPVSGPEAKAQLLDHQS